MKFVVLGGYGIIGKAVVDDLFHSNADNEIIIAGRDFEKARNYANFFDSKRVIARKININNQKEVINLLKKSDVCVNCLQYEFNVQVMRACIKAKIDYLDLGGLFHETKKQLKLHNDFKKIRKTAILGCGSTPGITNVMAGYGSKFLKKINSIEITFADKDETNYNKFVLPYSFKTIIDEYTLKPVIFKNGKLYFVKPYSGFKYYDFGKEFGKLKGFYTLHSELATFPDSFKNKGLKNCEFRVTFPENFNEKIETLINLGFTSKEKINSKNKEIETLEITSEIMERNLPKPNTKIKDKELIRVIFNSGRLIMDCLTTSNKFSAGILDTAVPCSIIAQMIANNNFLSGVYPPEKIVPLEKFFKELKKRKIFVYKNGKRI